MTYQSAECENVQGDPTVILVIEKGRIAPARLTVTRLKMLGALLGAQLFSRKDCGHV